ncbi:MAG TPA: bifunctional hydroxymethylpyrimidine kinase/phosphomethylpyrimidine kinase [Candidatus Saccharimonadales bacterium]|nr:bifunctional hydroxymethylpyrimidine kinase/phosphomethylpyrimidine kinase [Candidatus Saccharimonadales bacterium]
MSKQQASALTIAGSDSGGGAGIQADLKTFAALDLHGTSVITCLTAQNPNRVLGIQETSAAMVRKQLEAVFEAFPPRAMKTGMLYSTRTIREVARFLRGLKHCPALIVDPVLISTSGKRLLQQSAIRALTDELFPLATLITPNVPEAEALGGYRIVEVDDLKLAAQTLHASYGCAVLVKGGHLKTATKSIDVFYDGQKESIFSAPRVPGIKTHGTGCTYSAAIVGYMALGQGLQEAVGNGKKFITRAIAHARTVEGNNVLLWTK